jgi:alkanesulfonate monooxygenase SsuD/methylene tetrahydromethanopterin reductase-like flavin-dependent oxidoreductase (luciferase family)
LWQPVLAAEQIGTLASIAQGPFILQCAVGGGDAQFAAMGASLRDRGTRFESSLETVRRLCAGEAVDGVKIAPIPPEPLQVWIGAAAPKAVDRAARVADAFLIGPEATPAQIDDLVRMYRDARAQHGQNEGIVAVRRDIHVGADDNDAHRVAGPVIDAGYRGFDPSAPVVGGPEKVAAAFKSLNEKGCTEVVVRHLAEDQQEVLKSYERLARVKQLLTS